MDGKKLKSKIKTWLVAMGLAPAVLFPPKTNATHAPDLKDTARKTEINLPPPPPENFNKIDMQEACQKGWCQDIAEFIDKTTYKVDTIVLNKDNHRDRFCAAAYRPNRDDVLVKYFVADTLGAGDSIARKIIDRVARCNSPALLRINLAHEWKHRDTRSAMLQYCTAEDYARLCQHNEIASRCASLVYELETYKKASQYFPDYKDNLLNIFEEKYKDFANAIKNGVIDPFSSNKHEQKLLQYALVKTACKWWVGAEQPINIHVSRTKIKGRIKNVKGFLNRTPSLATKKAYRAALDRCYTYMMDGKLVNMNFFSDNTSSVFSPNKILEAEWQRRWEQVKQNQEPPRAIAGFSSDRLSPDENIHPLLDVNLRPEITALIKEQRELADKKKQCTAEDVSRLSQHQEISSLCAEVIDYFETYKQVRQYVPDYKDSLTNIFADKYTDFVYAVKTGVIDPLSLDKHEQNLCQYALVKNVCDWWVKNEQSNNIEVSRQKLLQRMKTEEGFLARASGPSTQKAYRTALDSCYTFMVDGKLVNMNFFADKITDGYSTNKLLEAEWQTRLAHAKQNQKHPCVFTKFSPAKLPMSTDGKPLTDVSLRPEIARFLYQQRQIADIKQNVDPLLLGPNNRQTR